MERKEQFQVKESNVSMTATKQMANIHMINARFEHPLPLLQMSFIPFGCLPLVSPKHTAQLNNLMPYIPSLMPPSPLGKPESVHSFSEYNIVSREIYYGSVQKTDTCLKEGESSIQSCQKSLTKASQASKSPEPEVSVTEKFCNIAKKHGLTVELVKDEEFPALSRKESQRCPLTSTQPIVQTFDSSCPKALDNKKNLNPLVDVYIPHAFQHPGNEANVDFSAEENSVTNSAEWEPMTGENLSITKSQPGKDVLTEPVCVQQTKPPLRPLLLPNMPKTKKIRTVKDAAVQTDKEMPDSRLCPICQGKPSDADKCSVTPVFKKLNLEQKTKYLALQASFLLRVSSEVTKSQDEWKKTLKKKLQMLYKQLGTKDIDVSDWEDELICQVVISLLNDSPALASPDQNSMLLARLREEVNILNEITASLMESPVTSKPPLDEEIKNPLVPTVINADETLPDNPHSATKSALMSSQGSVLMAEGMHLSNSSSGVSLSSADLSTGPAIPTVVSSTALAGCKVGIVSVSNKNHTANPIQKDTTPKLAVPDAVDDKTLGPLVNKVICPNQTYCPSLQQFLDSLASSHPSKSCNPEQKTYPTSMSSTNSTPDHLQRTGMSEKSIVISVEQKGNVSSVNPETIKTTVDSHRLDNALENKELKTYAKLLSTIGHSETRNQGLKPLVIRPLDKLYKAPGYSQDSIDSPFEDALKSSAFENIEKADKLRSRTQSETSDLSNKDALTTVTVSKPNAVQVPGQSMQCEVDQQAEDLRKIPGRWSMLKTQLEAKPISLPPKISSDKRIGTFSSMPSSSSSISHLSVSYSSNPLMQSHNLMLNPPLSVTAFSGSITNVSNSGSCSAAVLQTSSELSDESPSKKLCMKAPLNVRVRKVSRQGLQSVKDWVTGNLESTYNSDPCSRSSVESHSVNNRTSLPENKSSLYTPQSLLNKYCYSSVAARLIALASRGSQTFPSLSNVSNASPEDHYFATIIKSSPLKTPTVVSSDPACLSGTPMAAGSKWSWKEGDISSWKVKSGSHSSLNNNEDFQTEKSSIAHANFGDHDEEMQSDRIWGNMFKLNQDTQAPQIGGCKLDLTLCNLNSHVGDHSAMKSSKRQDWFDIDNISLSESFSSLNRDDIYTVGDMLSCSSVLNNNKTNKKSMDGSDEFHDYFTRKPRHSHLEDISPWEGNVKGEINGNTDQVKPDTKKSSGDDNLVWMKVTNAKIQKVSISDRLEEFRQQEKYKNLTTRILEIYKNLTREEAQDVLETVFTETHGMVGMRQPQILSEVQAALTELYPEKIIVQKKVNLNISAKYSTANSNKNINKSAQSKDSTLRSSGNVSKHTSAIDNNSSVSDSDSSDDSLQTSEWNSKKQVCLEHASNFSPIFPKVVSTGKILLKKCDNIKNVSESADEAVHQCTENDLTRSHILVSTDNADNATILMALKSMSQKTTALIGLKLLCQYASILNS